MKSIYERFTKRTLLAILIVHFSMLSFAATYYVSSTGNDSNSGLATTLAWKTMAKVNSATFKAGDQILFNRGETFYGSLTISQSGVSGSPITLGAYGTGENPIITGFTNVSAWTNLGSNIWESTSTVSSLSTCNLVTVNDVNTAMGRYPNADATWGGYLPFQSHSGLTSITSSSLTGTPNWTGAEIRIRTSSWSFGKSIVTSQSGSTLNFNTLDSYTPVDRWGFFIQNDVKTLDAQNEWYYNPLTKKIRIYSTSQPANVKVASVDNLLIINGDYITIDGINLLGANGNVIYTASTTVDHVNIQNCSVLYAGNTTLQLRCAYFDLQNNTIAYANNKGISLDRCSNVTFKNNNVHDISILAGMGNTGNSAFSGLNGYFQSNVLIEANTFTNFGGAAIEVYGDNVTVKNNVVDTFGFVIEDLGGIYSYVGTGIPFTKVKIEGNIVINGIGAINGTYYAAGQEQANGIYLDDNSNNVEVFNNIVANCSAYGLFLHNTHAVNVHNNTVYNNKRGQIQIKDDSNGGVIENNILTGNIFVSRSASQKVLYCRSSDNNISTFGGFSDNYYARPIDDNLTITVDQPSLTMTNQTLSGWQTFSGQDANSKKSPQTIVSESDLQLEYNATAAPKAVTLSRSMIDVKGVKYSSTITLQPFTSVVLMKDLSATSAVAPGAPTSPIATAGNASASVTFVAPANNGGSAITGYTVTSLPAGGVDSNAGSTLLTHNITGLTNGTSYTFTVKATNSVGASVASIASNSVIPIAPVAASFTFTGPSSGNLNNSSTNFTVTPTNLYTGTITITPSGTGSAGLSTIVLNFSNSATPQTFTILPTAAGSITLTPTNSGSLTNPANLTYTTNAVAPSAPTSPVATAGNASASVTFVAPTNNGGSTITGYTVTSVPAGGTDSNAGSTSLTHNITGLTNGTSYTFTVKATNSVGSSVASVASNSVIPKAPAATGYLFTGPFSGSINSASSNFTVTPNNLYTGTITITPSGTGSAGLSAKVLTFSNSSAAQTFTITPTVAGSITLIATNNGTLNNPANLTYNVNAVVPNAPTSVVATSGDASVSVSFMAPINTGGSPITGYTVTSNPAGGTDINAGSTALTHTITGLTNGTSYTFTVNAINSVGSSIASVASNSVIPVAASVIIKQGEIIPSHFITVWEGLNGLNHMNINIVSAVLEDIPLSVDDEIAVFSGSACVGTSKLTKAIVPDDNSTFLTILASQNDGSGNGFIDNDTIVFKIWNSKTQNELQVNSVVYRNDVSTWKTNGRYSPGATTVVEIASYQVYTQSIELLKGYNMISTYVSAQNPNVSNVTKTLLDQGNLIKMQDETGNSFENWGTFGGWINQLGSLEETEGYKIQVANNCILQVTGRPIAMPFDISLKTGWNIISFPRTDVVNAMNVVQALIGQNKLVKVQDEAGNSIENWGLFGGWKNGIGNFIPGKAYKIKMSVDAILTFQESYPKSALVIAQSQKTEYYHSLVEGNGTDHMNINITGLNNIDISVGDELAAFDGAVCVATTKITEANLLSGSASLASSYSTDNQNPNGFNVGDQIQILVWNKLSGNESIVNTEIITGQMKYEKNASVLVKMKSATIATGIANLENVVKIDVFPNPCQGKVTVRFSEIPEDGSRIEISDISGRKLVSRLISGTSEEFNLESFTPGLYVVKSILGSTEFVQKLIVNK
jgi:parallel beta-helix repeat protein